MCWHSRRQSLHYKRHAAAASPSADPNMPTKPSPSPGREAALAGLGLGALLAAFYAVPLWSGGLIDSDIGVFADPFRKHFKSGAEHFFLGFAWFESAARALAEGRFPSWSPWAACGAPFVGKQQPGIFFPTHILYYLWPSPFAWTAMLLLRHLLAGLGVFVLARAIGLKSAGAFLAGALYMLCPQMLRGMEAQGAADVALPLLLLATEQFLTGERRKALLLLPLAAALSACAGHPETSVRSYLFAGAVVAIRLSQQRLSLGAGGRSLAHYTAAGASGALVAAAQLLPALEYYRISYARFWRTDPQFGFSLLSNMAKDLSLGDAGPLVAAVGAAGAAVAALSQFLGLARGEDWRKALPWAGGACLFMGAAVACWLNIGMWAFPFEVLGLSWTEMSPAPALNLAAGAAAYTLVALALSDPGGPAPVPAFGWIALAGALLYLNVPPLPQLIAMLPLLQGLHLGHGTFNIELYLSLAVLAGAGWDRLASLGAAPSRRAPVALAAGLCAIIAAGVWLGSALQGPAADWLGSGINPKVWNEGQNERVGGIIDAGEISVWEERTARSVRGWVPARPMPHEILVGFLDAKGELHAAATARAELSGSRVYFKGGAPLPPGGANFVPVAIVSTPQGKRVLHGSRVLSSRPWILGGLRPVIFMAALGLGAAVWAMPLGPRLAALLAGPLLLALTFLMGLQSPSVHHASRHLAPIPALKRLPQDVLFRVHSRDQSLLTPEGSGLYGLQDFRNFDALGPITHSHFSRLAYHAFYHKDPKLQALGAELMGLANVKYILSRAGVPPQAGNLEPVYRGELDVYRNKGFKPRAAFFTEAMAVTGQGLIGWDSGIAVLERVLDLLKSGKLDPRKTLLLHEEALPPRPAADPLIKSARVEIASYEPERVRINLEAPRSGFLFLGDTYFPGWQVTVDGRPGRILLSWINFRAVAVAAGKHAVEFRYEPAMLRTGVGLTLAALAALLAALGLLPKAGGTNPWLALGERVLLSLIGASAVYWLCWWVWAHWLS